MELPIREIRLIEVLLRHPGGLTADGLADLLGVSARTVHRDLQPASEFLASRDLTLVRQAGRGINVEGPASARARALEALSEMRSLEFTPEERRVSLLGMLLGSSEPLKCGRWRASKVRSERSAAT